MAEYIKSERFIEIALAFQQNLDAMLTFIQSDINPQATKKDLKRRLMRYRLKGLLPLDSGNRVSAGELLKGTSTLKLGALTSNSYRIIPLIAGNSL